MNSCLYQCQVSHQRLFPKEHGFRYNVFMFYLDLDEIAELSKKVLLFSYKKANWFSFRDSDHLQFPQDQGRNEKSVKENVLAYLEDQGIKADGKIMLLSNVATLGYSFNPISFYICYDKDGSPLCSVAEVCNTHGEMKLYLLERSTLAQGEFRKLVSKHFYVSPFSDLDSSFDFIFKLPAEKIHMRVDDYQQGRRFLLSSLTGTRKELTGARLFWYGVRFPLITLKIITLIHWQALILRLKRMPYHRKDENLHLQKENYRYKKV